MPQQPVEIAGRRIGDLVEEVRRHGRGARSNRTGRFEAAVRENFDDGWQTQALDTAAMRPLATEVRLEIARSIIGRNDSPDISFEQSINPYRGCEHGCTYCYARPTHGYLGHSSGLDFETILYAKTNAAQLLARELSRPGYVPRTIALGTATDPYQPVERQHRITRQLLEVLEQARHPVGIVTKSALVVRDIDILSRMARHDLVKVGISLTTLDRQVARSMEPRAATPERRLEAIGRLAAAGVPTLVMTAPIIPGLNDHEIERILQAAASAGAREAGYVLLRLPLDLKDVFREWLATDFPDRANRVLHLLQAMHGGRDYRAAFGVRQRGTGAYAALLAQRFRLGLQRYGLDRRRLELRTDRFVPPRTAGRARAGRSHVLRREAGGSGRRPLESPAKVAIGDQLELF